MSHAIKIWKQRRPGCYCIPGKRAPLILYTTCGLALEATKVQLESIAVCFISLLLHLPTLLFIHHHIVCFTPHVYTWNDITTMVQERDRTLSLSLTNLNTFISIHISTAQTYTCEPKPSFQVLITWANIYCPAVFYRVARQSEAPGSESEASQVISAWSLHMLTNPRGWWSSELIKVCSRPWVPRHIIHITILYDPFSLGKQMSPLWS